MTASRTTLWPLLLLLAALSAPALLLAQRPAAHASAPADSVEELFLPLGKPYPSYLWYGNTFTDSRVRCAALPFDSLPDEIHIRLVNSADDFCFPVKGIKTSPYGWRWDGPTEGSTLPCGPATRSAVRSTEWSAVHVPWGATAT